MLSSVQREGEDHVKNNYNQSLDDHSGHMPFENFQTKKVEHSSKSMNDKKLKTKLPEYKMQAKAMKEKEILLGELTPAAKERRTMLVAKRGPENVPVPLARITLFFIEGKIVYAFHEDGNKYIVEENLTMLAKTLNKRNFFRANRQYIININYIKSFRAYERVKLKIDMSPDNINRQHTIIISQETAPAFREWIHSA